MPTREKHVSFASPYPGKIVPLDLSLGGRIICQKDAFSLCSKGVNIGIEFQRRLGTGLFGGRFYYGKLEGDGMALCTQAGTCWKDASTGELLKIDTGCIVGFTGTIDYDIQFVTA